MNHFFNHLWLFIHILYITDFVHRLSMCVCVRARTVPALIESVDFDLVVFVFLQDLLCILVGVEGVHEYKRHISIKGFV